MNARTRRWALLGVSAPQPGATREESLRFIRDLQLRWLPIDLVLLAVIALAGIGWPVVFVAAFTVLLALDAVWLTIRIRREGER